MSYRSDFYSPREIVKLHMLVNDLAPDCEYVDARTCGYARHGNYGATIERQLLMRDYPISAIQIAFEKLQRDSEIAPFCKDI